MTDSNTKQRIAASVENARRQVAPAPTPGQVAFTNYASWLGEWKLFDTNHNSVGTVTFAILPSGTDFTASIRMMTGEILVEKQWGSLFFESPTRMVLDWNSIAALRQSTGYSRFFLSNETGSMRIEQFRLGEPMVTFILKREV